MTNVATETWRTEAFCPEHSRLERIDRVRSTTPLGGTTVTPTFHAVVTLACGEGLTIVTTARNLSAMKETA